MKQFFEGVNTNLRSAESSIVNLISTLTPWLAPLIPAYMTFQHVVNYLDFPYWIAITTGLTVEFLGLASVSTTLAFWTHNRRYKRLSKSGQVITQNEYKRAPTIVPLATFAFYLTVVLTVNVVMDVYGEQAAILAKAMLTTLSIPAAVLIGSRVMHGELMDQIQTEREWNRKLRQENKEAAKVQQEIAPTSSQRRVEDYLQKHSLKPDDFGSGGSYSYTDLAQYLGIEPANVRVIMHRIKRNGSNGNE